MIPELVISAPFVMPLQVKTWAQSVQQQLPFPAKMTFRITGQSPGSPLSVKLVNSGRNSFGSYGTGNSNTTFPLPPVWDLTSRANTREIFLAILSRVVRHAYGRNLDQGSGEYRVIETREEALKWVKDRIGNCIISLDIEGDGDPSVLHPSRHHVLCLGLFDGTDTVILPESLFDSTWEEFADALEQTTTVAHNGKFDATVLGWILRGRNAPIKVTHDTMLAHYALWPAGGDDDEHADKTSTSFAYHGLKLLGDLYLGCGNWALDKSEYENMRSVPLKRLYWYNALDVQRTHALLRIFRDQFRNSPRQLQVYLEVLMPASHHLAWQEGTGIAVDVDYVNKELIPGMTERVQDFTVDLIKIVNGILPDHTWPMVAKAKRMSGEGPKEARRFNPGSANQVRTVLEYRGIQLPVDRKSKTGKGSTGKRTLELLLRDKMKGDPFLTKLLQRRGTEKLLGTYASPLATRAHEDHPYSGRRLFPIFHLHKTLTGRLSSSGPNIQNQPKSPEIRRSYIPAGSGRAVCQVDYGQAELRVMAVLGRDDYLKGVFNTPGLDLFKAMMPSIFPAVDFTADPDQYDQLRRQLKTVVYGTAYARGARDIAEDLNVDEKYAQSIINTFLATIPGVTAWRQEVLDHVRYGVPLVSRFGRYLLHEMVTDRNRDDINRRALSFLPQSSASDCCLLAAIRLGDYIRSKRLDWDITALIHDAIVLDVPQSDVAGAMKVTGDFMEVTARKWFPEVPFATDGTWGFSWADLDDKSFQKKASKVLEKETRKTTREEIMELSI